MHFLIGRVIVRFTISIFQSILAYGSSRVFSRIYIHESPPKKQDRFDRCPGDIQFRVSADERSAYCVNTWVFNTGYNCVGLCRIQGIYNRLLSQFYSFLKWGHHGQQLNRRVKMQGHFMEETFCFLYNVLLIDKNSVHLFYATLLNFVNMTNNKETCSNYVVVFAICNTVCAQVRVI